MALDHCPVLGGTLNVRENWPPALLQEASGGRGDQIPILGEVSI